jgi:hypothetical protein
VNAMIDSDAIPYKKIMNDKETDDILRNLGYEGVDVWKNN